MTVISLAVGITSPPPPRVGLPAPSPSWSADCCALAADFLPWCAHASLFGIIGTLLQVLELLQAARVAQGNGQHVKTGTNLERRGNAGPAQAADSFGALLRNIATQGSSAALEVLWLVDPSRSPCLPIRHAMLRVLEELASIVTNTMGGATGGATGDAQPLQSALHTAQELNFAEAIRPGSPGRRVPGRSLLVSAVVTAALQHRFGQVIVGDSQQGIVLERPVAGVGAELSNQELQFVLSLLRSSDVDVRDAAIKATKRAFGSRLLLHDSGTAAFSEESLLQVWVAAAEALTTEAHPPNMRRLVRLLVRVGCGLRRGSLPASSRPLWNHLRGLCDGSSAVGSEDFHGGALEVMGIMVRLGKPNPDRGDDSSSAVDMDLFAKSVESAASADQPVSMRAAAAASLASSGLLNAVVPSGESHDRHERDSVYTFVRLWFVALTLLQDDNQGVRLCAARACTAMESISVGAGGDKDLSGSSGGGRVEMCAVNLVLARLAAMAESRQDGGRTAEKFALNLLNVLSSMPGTNPEELVLMVSAGREKDCAAGAYPQGNAGLDESTLDENNGSAIFGREERNQYQEPALFACVAAPYLSRALAALDPTEGAFGEPVRAGLIHVLDQLADNLEALIGLLGRMSSATWLPGVYQGMIASLAVGTAVLESAVKHGCRERGVVTGGATTCGDARDGVVLAAEVARVANACSEFEAAFGGDKRVHPTISSAIVRALRATQFST